MSADRMLNALKMHAAQMAQMGGQPRIGLVSSYDDNTATAKVLLQPENVLTGWLPVLSPWVGAGWGLHAPLAPDDQVLVIPREGDIDSGIIAGRAFSDAARPPPAAAGEFWLVHASGATVKLLASGQVVISDPSGTTATFANNGTLAISGNVAITGNVTTTGSILASGNIFDQGGAHGTVGALRTAYDEHSHTDSRGGTTSPPTPQVP